MEQLKADVLHKQKAGGLWNQELEKNKELHIFQGSPYQIDFYI